jgi:hypothetical protein
MILVVAGPVSIAVGVQVFIHVVTPIVQAYIDGATKVTQ